MRTLSDIHAAEVAVRERAAEYEKLQGRRAALHTSISRLEGRSTDVSTLGQIRQLADRVPDGLQVRGSRFVPGGMDVKFALIDLITHALADAARKAEAERNTLTTARAELDAVEAALAELEAAAS